MVLSSQNRGGDEQDTPGTTAGRRGWMAKATDGKRKTQGKQGQPRVGKTARRKAELVKKIIEKIETKIDKDEVKATVGDLIRLMQIEKELEEERPQEIEVRWIEPTQEPVSGE
jgi:hypothetical protein